MATLLLSEFTSIGRVPCRNRTNRAPDLNLRPLLNVPAVPEVPVGPALLMSR